MGEYRQITRWGQAGLSRITGRSHPWEKRSVECLVSCPSGLYRRGYFLFTSRQYSYLIESESGCLYRTLNGGQFFYHKKEKARENQDSLRIPGRGVTPFLLRPSPGLALLVGDPGAPAGGKFVLVLFAAPEPLVKRDICASPPVERPVLLAGAPEPFIERDIRAHARESVLSSSRELRNRSSKGNAGTPSGGLSASAIRCALPAFLEGDPDALSA